jgi:hypothetical protein
VALTFTEKTASYDNVDRTTYTTASVTPAANKTLVLDGFVSGTSPVVTAVNWSGGGAAWTLEKEDNGSGRSVFRWRYQNASPPGANTIDIVVGGGSGITGCEWAVTEVDGQDTSGTNGSGAFVQSVSATGTGTAGNATLAAYSHANNRPLACLGVAVNAALTPELTGGTNSFGGSPATSGQTQWSTSTQDTTPSWTWTGSAAWRSIASEIKAAGGGTAHAGAAALVGVAAMTTAGKLAASGVGALQGVALMTSDARLAMLGAAGLQGVAVLTADGTVPVPLEAVIGWDKMPRRKRRRDRYWG